jgi:hypothetical protein
VREREREEEEGAVLAALIRLNSRVSYWNVGENAVTLPTRQTHTLWLWYLSVEMALWIYCCTLFGLLAVSYAAFLSDDVTLI